MNKISLDHGSGGKLTHDLIKNLFLKNFDNPILASLFDSAILEINGKKIAFTTDTYTVNPIFFPGGDIGKLAVYGTVNDLAVMGAEPLCISCSYVIEEGFDYISLKRITQSIAKAARLVGIPVVTGDTKVVERGKGDGIFINTSGIGICKYSLPQLIEIGDKILVSGTIGNHEIAILQARDELGIKSEIKSDCAPLLDLVFCILNVSKKIKFMRDPTRGGLATVLAEIAQGKEFGIVVREEKIPIKEEVKGICSLLGYDPLYLANEGKLIAIVGSQDADKVLNAMRAHKLGKEAEIIGEIVEHPKGMVSLKTKIGSHRILDMPVGTQLPRIC